ncbi:MAG TPA: hypothetical protein P5277_04760, partial [Candidatus Paceibacterota bacterium]|nr:hypothetical protein [Candidatus Paceibacterota bacterium]
MKKSVSKKNILFLFVIISIMIMFSFCVSAELTRPIHGRQDITLRLYDKSIPALGNYIVGSSKGAIPESLNPGWGSYQLTAGTEEILENPAVLKIHHSVYQDVNNDISPGEMIVKLDDSTEEITPLSQISFTVGENWNSISWVKPCSLRILGWCLKRERGYISGTGKNIIEFPNYKKAGFLLLNIEHDNYFSEEAIRCGDRILMHWSNYDQYGGTEDKKWLEVSSDEETLNYPIRLNDVASSFYIYEQDGGCCSGYNQCSAGELNSEKCIGNKEYKCEEVYNSVGEPQCYAWVETGDLCSEVIPTTCPNSVCNSELGENCNNCEDCACESGETCLYSGVCEVIIHSVSCWDGYCNGLVGEDCRTCPSDCACELGENCNTIGTISNCVSDNPDIIECGDGNCDYLAGEDCRTCPSDCACKPELGEICNTIGTISNCIINP